MCDSGSVQLVASDRAVRLIDCLGIPVDLWMQRVGFCMCPRKSLSTCYKHPISVRFSPLTNWVGGGGGGATRGRFSRDPVPVCFSAAGHCEHFWPVRGRMSAVWYCPSSISCADHGIAHPPRRPEGWFWRGCRGVWYARTMQVSVSVSC